MIERLKGILVLLPLLIAFFCGDIVVSVITAILSILAFLELKNALSNKKINLLIFPAYCLFAYSVLRNFGIDTIISVDIFIALFVVGFMILATIKRINRLSMMITIVSLLYAFVPFAFISWIYNYEVALAGLIFVISFSTDVFAYLTGKFFGKNKLAPKISPNKTIEGSLGGLICCTTISSVFALITGLNVMHVAWISAIGSMIAQCGDLFASSIKRYCQIKDFGKLIPGHGGILDRFDSVMFVAIFIKLFT